MTKLTKQEQLTEGKAKMIFATNDPQVVWIHSKNQATALNGKRKVQIDEKGYYTNQISFRLLKYLKQNGVANHLLEQVSETDITAKKLAMIPLEVVIRNYASGHFVTRFNVEKMLHLDPPVTEFYYKSDELDDPMINDSQIQALHIADENQIEFLRQTALKINQLLEVVFKKAHIKLVDFKVEFGFDQDGNIILGDELSPDNMRLVDENTDESLDKDVFRKNLGSLTDVYKVVLSRLQTELGE